GGMSPDAARAEALRQFGDVRAARSALMRVDTKETALRVRREWLGDWWMDVRQALRGLRRTPGVTVAVLVMLGLGIGGASAMFGLLDRLLLRVGPGIDSPSELQRIYVNEYSAWQKARLWNGGFNEPELRAIAGALPRSYPVGSMVVWGATLGGGQGPVVPIAFTSGDAFRVLGTRPARGRLLEPSDDSPAVEPAAVISYGLWHRSFGGADDVLGKTLTLGSTHYAIVGVAPRGFSGLQPDRVDVWVPMSIGAEAHYGRQWRP